MAQSRQGSLIGLILWMAAPQTIMAISDCRLKVRQGKNLVYDARIEANGGEIKFEENAFHCVAKPSKYHNQDIQCVDQRSKVGYGIVLRRDQKAFQGLPIILTMTTKEKTYHLQTWCD